MSSKKPKTTKRETVALAALREGMAIIKKGNKVFGLHADGSKELISESSEARQVWSDALNALRSRSNQDDKDSTTTEIDEKKTTKLAIYADGGSRGNPGPSAGGYVILTADEEHILEQGGKFLGVTTNNQAEYQAVKLALEAARKFHPQEIDFYVDSLLVANQLNGVFKVKNKELHPVHESIKQLVEEFDQVKFSHVYREHNKLADKQVNIILDQVADLKNNH